MILEFGRNKKELILDGKSNVTYYYYYQYKTKKT